MTFNEAQEVKFAVEQLEKASCIKTLMVQADYDVTIMSDNGSIVIDKCTPLYDAIKNAVIAFMAEKALQIEQF